MKTKVLDRLVEQLQSHAEGDNYHELIPIYDRIVRVLRKHVDEETALSIFISLEEAGGLM